MTDDIKKRQSLIKKIQSQAEKAKPANSNKKKTDLRLLNQFLPIFYQNISLDDLENMDELTRLHAGQSILDMAHIRKQGRHNVEIFTPTEKSHGWEPRRTIINIITDNMPFIIDSITQELVRRNFQILHIIHPMVRVERDKSGLLKSVHTLDQNDKNLNSESFVHIELSRQLAPSTITHLKKQFDDILTQVRHATGDWQSMLKKLSGAAIDIQTAQDKIIKHNKVDKAEISEAVEFLNYLADNHFTLLGYREYSLKNQKTTLVPNTGLGILRDDEFVIFDGYRDLKSLPPEVRKFRLEPKPLTIRKATSRALVHRHVPMDVIIVKKFNDKAELVGEKVFVGLFTSTLYSHSVQLIPYIRHKVARVLEHSGFRPASHDYKAMIDILEKFPRDELFQITLENLEKISHGILDLKERKRTAFFYRIDDFERFVTCMVYVPRDRYGTPLRQNIQAILEHHIGGECSDYYANVSESNLARVIYVIKTTPGKTKKFNPRKIEKELVEVARSWEDKLRTALIEKYGDDHGAELGKAYRLAFDDAYQASSRIVSAVEDIGLVENLLEKNKTGGDITLDLFHPTPKETDLLHIKLYHSKTPVPLSDILPILENMGLFVITEKAYKLSPRHADFDVWIHDFSTRLASGETSHIQKVRTVFLQALEKIWLGQIENDGLNKLVLSAGLNAEEINIVRAYARYLRQGGLTYSRELIEHTLQAHPEITGLLLELFHARFNPNEKDDRSKKTKTIENKILGAFENVTKIDQDHILRAFLLTIKNTLRTNFYQTERTEESANCLAFKLDSKKLDFLPLPRPYVEIFVFGPHVEGIHLRGGEIARGGLRWSDRPDDFRTEVLGLLKAQMVKNSVIVPVGAKGGFIVKNPPIDGGRDAFQAEGIRCYKSFVSNLLDITDNIVNGKVVPPKNTVRHDCDDPYLVVAADKGTATFSDIANSLSEKYKFWLGDAFASGGSVGYDHKAMGITAKGAWESVKRHFREIGKDIQKQDFTVIGVGDMSGDVFGNGMLRSKHIKLLAAFNHMHIFCDPNPDTAKSFAERERLFKMPRSAWSDYSDKILSNGGRIYERSAKSLTLTKEIKAAFGLSKDVITPDELIRVLLAHKADLLWFGGIGTYVKARTETHADVGDKANESIRLNATEIKAAVIGEGANLGMTQRARIEFAQNGGRLNADFIDNSAGVDTSDHEVNIKILTQELMAGHKPVLTLKQRNKMLVDMQDEVESLVLRNNYQQTQAISLSESKAPAYLQNHMGFLKNLEKKGMLSRAVEYLPDDDEIKNRVQRNMGLTRPELSILISYSKITLFNQLLDGNLPDCTDIHYWMENYFPALLRKKFAVDMPRHKLKRQIIATELANSICNRMGPLFVQNKIEKTGASAEQIARAYVIVKDVAGLNDLWAGVEALDNKVPAAIQTDLLIDITRLSDRLMTWLLLHDENKLDIKKSINHYKNDFDALCTYLDSILGQTQKRQAQNREKQLLKDGVPAKFAKTVSLFPAMASAFEIIRIARNNKQNLRKIAEIYYNLGNRFGLDWLRGTAKKLKSTDYWSALALNGIVDDLFHCQAELTLRIIADKKSMSQKETAQMIEYWASLNGGLVEQIDTHIETMRRENTIDLSMMMIADQKIRMLSGV